MAKITKHEGPTIGVGDADRGGLQTSADVLRERGKLGPYEEAPPVALQICAQCSTASAADLAACPHCGSTDLAEEGLRVDPGTGVEMDEVEMVVDEDGVAHGEIDNDGSGHALPPVGEEQEAEGGEPDNEVEPDAQPVDATTPRPATNASKGEWVAYVAALEGVDEATISEAYTKAELVEQYGKG